MKKSNFYTGIVSILVGLGCLAVALTVDSNLNSLLYGFAGAGIIPGISMIIKYMYWTSDKNRSRDCPGEYKPE